MARTTGSTSCVRLNLQELNRVLKENATVIVNRRYAEALNLACHPFKTTTPAINKVVSEGVDAPEDSPPPIAINIMDFNE
jgi:hypothetical protein|tara:strand:+ start:373 stop:612 length:240 start_codon:yes stop_codon:yes gene_type:complete